MSRMSLNRPAPECVDCGKPATHVVHWNEEAVYTCAEHQYYDLSIPLFKPHRSQERPK